MSNASVVQRLTGIAIAALLAFALLGAAQAQAAGAPRGDKAAKPQLVPAKVKKTKRPRPAVNNKDLVTIGGGTGGMVGVGTGCTAPSLQTGGWWYRWCGLDWQGPFSSAAVLLEYQHQYYYGGRWVGYLSTWCQPRGGCVYMGPSALDQAYSFFYQ